MQQWALGSWNRKGFSKSRVLICWPESFTWDKWTWEIEVSQNSVGERAGTGTNSKCMLNCSYIGAALGHPQPLRVSKPFNNISNASWFLEPPAARAGLVRLTVVAAKFRTTSSQYSVSEFKFQRFEGPASSSQYQATQRAIASGQSAFSLKKESGCSVKTGLFDQAWPPGQSSHNWILPSSSGEPYRIDKG